MFCATRPLFLTIDDLDDEVPELRRTSLALTLLYFASKYSLGLSLGPWPYFLSHQRCLHNIVSGHPRQKKLRVYKFIFMYTWQRITAVVELPFNACLLYSTRPERDRVFADLTPEEKERFKADIRATNILLQDSTFDDDLDKPPVQDLALNVDHVFQSGQCDAFNSDVDEAPTAQTMFMSNLLSVDPIYDESGPSYDLDILSVVQDHDNYIDSVGEYHEVHEMQNDVQQNYVVDSYAEYTSDNNIILYEQYVKDNAVKVVQSNVSSVPNDALMMIINDMHEQAAQCIYVNEQNKAVNESLTVELARYKEQVEVYEKRARFELTESEQKIDEQLRLMIDEVATLKKDFKQKENKYLEDFLDMKALKEKVEDKLFKQDQSLQIVHMLYKPKSFYDEKKKVAIGYKNPLYLTSAMQVKSALYNGHEIVKANHAPAVVHDLEDTLELAEITRKKMLEKMQSLLCVEKKVKIAPPVSEQSSTIMD
ncbi:hypothetical protein Tco_1500550 [Tanacetum coccineum]